MKAKFINENIGDVLKPKSKEEIIEGLGDAPREQKMSYFLEDTEKFFSMFNWLSDQTKMKIINKTIKEYHNKMSYWVIENIIENINKDNREDWEETAKEILDSMDDYDLNTLLHYYK